MTHFLVALLIVVVAANAIVDAKTHKSVLARTAADPRLLGRFFFRAIAPACVITAFVAVIALTDGDLSAADLGWTWSTGGYFGLARAEALALTWLFTAIVIAVLVIGNVRARRHLRTGKQLPGRADPLLVLPRETGARYLTGVMAVTLAVSQEAIFRGLLISVGVQVYHLPVVSAAAISLALAVAAGAQSGRRTIMGVTLLASLATYLYLASGSIFPGVLAVAVNNLMVMFNLPARPTPQRTPAEPPEPIEPSATAGAGPTQSPPTRLRPAQPEAPGELLH